MSIVTGGSKGYAIVERGEHPVDKREGVAQLQICATGVSPSTWWRADADVSVCVCLVFLSASAVVVAPKTTWKSSTSV